MPTRLLRLRRSPLAARVTRYSIGSAVALATSAGTFALLLHAGVGTTACSVLAFLAGAVPNWILNRSWAWRMSGRVSLPREVLVYGAISGLALIFSAGATGLAQTHAGTISSVHDVRVAFVTAIYVAVQAALFLAKFLAYDRWVFAGRSRLRAALRSRHQVWSAARANRAP